MNEHEAGFLRFVLPPQQRRLRTLFELGEKRRGDVRALFDHTIRLDPRHAFPLPGGHAFPPEIERELRGRGAPSQCHVLSSKRQLDGRQMPLGDALGAVVGSGNGAFISCIPGVLGYFEHESAGTGRILSLVAKADTN